MGFKHGITYRVRSVATPTKLRSIMHPSSDVKASLFDSFFFLFVQLLAYFVIKLHVRIKKLYCCSCLVSKSFPTLCNPVDCSPPGSSVYGISQARILEWIAISFSMILSLFPKFHGVYASRSPSLGFTLVVSVSGPTLLSALLIRVSSPNI